MPTYQYTCTQCSHDLEARQGFSDDPLKTCPECGVDGLRKQYGSVGVVFKGSGFYRNDSRNGNDSRSSSSSDGSRGSSESSDSKSSDTKSETKSESSSAKSSESKSDSKPKSDGAKSEKKSTAAATSS
ncbi:MAG TPA: FmdB family transcriptional regulator [Candidatus Stackebrandtia faecavium]|nr:FmdB family transcriptional regulator [Candidatus Stackebrandtia faecavium]